MRTFTYPHPIETHQVSPTLFDTPETRLSKKQLELFKKDSSLYLANKINTYTYDGLKKPLKLIDQILGYLFGYKKFEEICILLTDVQEALLIVKVCDQLNIRSLPGSQRFLFSSYRLRTKILEVGSPYISAAEVYTKTLDYRLINDPNYLINAENWVPERCALHARLIANLLINACALSKRLNFEGPTCIAIRGNTAVGKNSLVLTEKFFDKALIEGKLKGEIDPDVLNHHLQKETGPFVTSCQVHTESCSLLSSFEERFHKEAVKASTIILKRLSNFQTFLEQVLIPNILKKGVIHLFDIAQADLRVSILRVLTRDPYTSLDPVPHFRSVLKGHVESFKYRKKFIDAVKKNPLIFASFKIFIDCNGQRSIGAEKKLKDRLKILSCIPCEPRLSEIEKVRSSIITQDLISAMIEKGNLLEIHRPAITKWIGFTFQDALTCHSLGGTAKILTNQNNLKKYGSLPIERLSTTWLNDLGYLRHHLNFEQKDTQYLDDTGRPVHWNFEKFSTHLNPDLNCDARIQMRLGYFIVPESQFKFHISEDLSLEILKDLTISKDNQKFYRFFVHPDAYHHFQNFHDRFSWISPENSEFMGTPTSSNRSWLLRKVSKTKVDPKCLGRPFILKMGINPTLFDTTRFIGHEDISKSLKYQKILKQFENEHLTFFYETGGIEEIKAHYYMSSSSRVGIRKDSGLLIREIHSHLLNSTGYVVSLSGLLCSQGALTRSFPPYILYVIESAITHKMVKNTAHFFKKFLINDYFKAIEQLTFVKGISLASHGQNLGFLLDLNLCPKKFIYRDFEGIEEENILESYLSYRDVITKLLNSVTRFTDEFFPLIPGAPLQRGINKKLAERSVYNAIFEDFCTSDKETYHKYCLSFGELIIMLEELDRTFFKYLAKYFDLEKAGIDPKIPLPAAESGSIGEAQLREMNSRLYENRK